ncbi:MAG TPA: Type 1 glutamine amidotransferase-like domain-containing protein [Pyrinomonadaceae bacterium]|nr:Type 1 glutamine amidotransferase-like domain-containing protein [Pyrinomonadaceae bacterium]
MSCPTVTVKPIFLLADSRPLFGPESGMIRASIGAESPRAVYIGASNGDDPSFYSIFEAAMEKIGIGSCRMIPASITDESAAFINQADIILLAGGSVESGWRTFEANGLSQTVIRRYGEGATLIGVSAGAVQLGMFGWGEEEPSRENLFKTFNLVPYIVSAHDEERGWVALQQAVNSVEVGGLGIPAGGGIIYHPDHTIEPLTHPVHEFARDNERIRHYLLSPGQIEKAQELTCVC